MLILRVCNLAGSEWRHSAAQQTGEGVVEDNVAGSFSEDASRQAFEGQVSSLGLVEQHLLLADVPV